jgi:hypothetical protein
VNYEYSVEWIEGCTTTVANESVYTPTGSDEGKFTCLGIWSDCYEKCEYLTAAKALRSILAYDMQATTVALEALLLLAV